MMGLFVFIVNLVAGQSKNIKKFFLKLFRISSGGEAAKA